jgi:hypothetical protein
MEKPTACRIDGPSTPGSGDQQKDAALGALLLLPDRRAAVLLS